MTAFADQAAGMLTYTVDSGGHPWQIAGTPGRMSETEARRVLTEEYRLSPDEADSKLQAARRFL